MTLPKTLGEAPEELQAAIREFWSEEHWDEAASISWLESGWRWDALDDTTDADHPCGSLLRMQDGVRITAERSIGYFQINACNHPDWPAGHLYNVRQNAGTAHSLWDAAGQSWSPWYYSARTLGLL